jgi:anti-sigma factor RsiW
MRACQAARDALSAYVDGELAPDRAAEVAEHLMTCSSCSTEYQALLETVGTLRSQLERYTAPDVLRARIRAAVATTPTQITTERRTYVLSGGRRRRRMVVVAAAIVVGAALGSAATFIAAGGPRREPSVASEVLASHLRSLMPEHLTDIRSSDQHNVKPWFNGRLDYSPSVPRFDDQGFPLIGGRVDYIGGRPVAVVVYGRRQHLINVFSWPTSAGGAPVRAAAAKGYNMFFWRSGGIERWVVSDVNPRELQSFVMLLQRSDST